MNDALKNLLNETGIDPAPKPTAKESFDEKFGGDPLKDLFGYFGEIFGGKFHEDRERNYREAEEKKKRDEDL